MNFLHSNDRLGEHAASWYAHTSDTLSFPTLENDSHVDVCVIGAGLTGLSAALELARSGKSVIVLEAHRVGWGASGRNGGQLGTGFNRHETLIKRLGTPVANQLWQIAEQAKATVHELCDKYTIDCEYQPGIVYALRGKRAWRQAQEYCDHFGSAFLYKKLIALSQSELMECVNSPDYQAGILDTGAGHLHPLKLCLGLGEAARSEGAQVFELSEARSLIHRSKHSGTVTVTTDKAVVVADNVIVACNGYLDNLLPEIASYVFPINNFMLATEPLGELANSILPNNHAVADDRFVVNYFRLSKDQRLLFGGGETYSHRFPKNISKVVQKSMLGVFPQLRSVQIDNSWGGTLAITENRLPFVRELMPSVYTAGGYSGHGVALATETGRLIAKSILGKNSDFQCLAAIPHRKFPRSALFRGALLRTTMTAAALIDRL